ncbi:MAG: sulfatase [Bryobacterales bacterium]|nr:sulfatase [Bryobacterales bacterium]
MLSRRRFLSSLGISSFAGASLQPPLNFVFLLADDLGWSDLSCYGADLHETPNLDAFARSAVRFTNAYAAAPVCSPTRASFLTGKYPARLQMTTWHEAAQTPPLDKPVIPPKVRDALPLEEVTIAELLRRRGYATGHVGKWHLGTATHYPEAQGYDVNVGGTLWGAPQTYWYPYTGSRRYGGEFRYVPGLRNGRPGEYLTDRLTDEALEFVKAVSNRPFYLNLWFHTPHTPIEGKPAYVAQFKEKLRPGLHHTNAGYAAMVKSLDENVGRVLRYLDESGLADRTVVVFASDNGGSVGNFDGQRNTTNFPLRSGKGSLYEGGLRVPFMMRWPGLSRAGATCEEPIVSNDLHATVLGADLHDGLNLQPLLRDQVARLAREELYFHYPHYYETTTPVSAIRTRRWKLLEYLEDNRLELYDLPADPAESNNVAASRPEIANDLRERLHKWRVSVNAPMPTSPKMRG